MKRSLSSGLALSAVVRVKCGAFRRLLLADCTGDGVPELAGLGGDDGGGDPVGGCIAANSDENGSSDDIRTSMFGERMILPAAAIECLAAM